MSYLNRFLQNVIEDTNNGSTANLASGAIFVGTATSTLGVAGIQVSLKSDQNCEIHVYQAPSTSLVDGKGTTAANNTTTMTGTGTEFLNEVEIGDTIVFDSGGTPQTKVIASITSDTVLDVTVAFTGGSLTGKTYQHYPWDVDDEYDYQANREFGVTTQAINSYVRVTVQNIGSSTTSYLRLQTALCPIVEAVPRSLSEEGNLKVGVYEIEDEVGSKVRISPNGALSLCKSVRLAGVTFSGTTIDANFWTWAGANNGSGVQTGGQFELRTITAPATSSANGASALQSVRSGRYVNGVPNLCRMQVDFGGAAIANNTKRWGCFTGTAGSPTDGAMFELINQAQSVAVYTGGTPTRISNGSFNGDYGRTIPTPTSVAAGIQTFEIIYNSRYVYFYFNNVLVHKLEAATAPWSSTLSFPLRAENYNTASSTTDTSLKIRSFVILRYGEQVSQPTSYYHAAGVTAAAGVNLKFSSGNIHSITFQSLNNSVITLSDSLTVLTPIIFATTGIAAVTQPVTIDLRGIPFFAGLRLGVIGANSTVTVIYE